MIYICCCFSNVNLNSQFLLGTDFFLLYFIFQHTVCHAVESKSQEDEGRAVFEFAVMSLQTDEIRIAEQKNRGACICSSLYLISFNFFLFINNSECCGNLVLNQRAHKKEGRAVFWVRYAASSNRWDSKRRNKRTEVGTKE